MEGKTEKRVDMAEWRFCLKNINLVDIETVLQNATAHVKTHFCTNTCTKNAYTCMYLYTYCTHEYADK